MAIKTILLLHPRGRDAVGFLPQWINEDDPRPAREQLNEGYAHGGGWHKFEGFRLEPNNGLTYPGDPTYEPLAMMLLRDERIFVYDSGWVAIVQPNRSYEVARMD